MPAQLQVETDWPISFLGLSDGGGIGYWQITTGVATDFDDFVVGGTGGLGIAPGTGNIELLVKDYSITRGRQSELDRVTAGEAIIAVDNPSALWSPLNTTGCLSGSLLPGRRVNIAWNMMPDTGAAASRFYRFVGELKSISVEPDVMGNRNVVLICTDDFNKMQRRETRSTLYQNVKSGSLAGSILDDAGFFTTCRVIADGQDTYNYAYFERRKLDEVLVDIERTEYGFMYIRGDGAFVFHDRHYRSTTLTTSASFSDTMSGITYYRSDDDLATEAETPYTVKIQRAGTTVWTLQSPISIPAGTAASFFGSYLDPTTCQLAPALGVASPVFGTGACFFGASDGTGIKSTVDMSGSFTAFAESFKFAASNSGSATNWLTTMTVTGCPLISYEQNTATALDATACALYGKRTLVYGGQDLIHTAEKANNFAAFLVNRFKDPTNLDDVTIVINNGNDISWEQLLRRELDDRISLTNTPTAISGVDVFIGKIDERYSQDGLHTVTWKGERASTQGDFVVDLSEIGGTAGLGY